MLSTAFLSRMCCAMHAKSWGSRALARRQWTKNAHCMCTFGLLNGKKLYPGGRRQPVSSSNCRGSRSSTSAGTANKRRVPAAWQAPSQPGWLPPRTRQRSGTSTLFLRSFRGLTRLRQGLFYKCQEFWKVDRLGKYVPRSGRPGFSFRPLATYATVSSSTTRIVGIGIGISDPLAEDHGGLGLRIMRNRAAIIRATLTIEPAKPAGTLVTCALPRKYHEP